MIFLKVWQKSWNFWLYEHSMGILPYKINIGHFYSTRQNFFPLEKLHNYLIPQPEWLVYNYTLAAVQSGG